MTLFQKRRRAIPHDRGERRRIVGRVQRIPAPPDQQHGLERIADRRVVHQGLKTGADGRHEVASRRRASRRSRWRSLDEAAGAVIWASAHVASRSSGFTKEVMSRVADDLGEPGLNWIAVCHFDTDQPHAHVLVRGRSSDGRDLVIPRDYIGYGFRARAQEVAQERLGDLSRQDAERRIWRETEADRFTAFDRRLLAAAGANGCVDDGIGGTDAWTALTRGRLRHLERLGLAVRSGRRFQLSTDLEAKLRRLQLSKDVIRTLNQRRLEGARSTEQLGKTPVQGKVVKTGFHDELGGSAYVVVRAADGSEYYGRLGVGMAAPAMGKTVTLSLDGRGFAQVLSGKQLGQDLGR